MYKLKRLKKDRALITIQPPKIASRPGFSPKTNQTKIGARTDSNKISNETSEELIKRGPSVSKQEEAPIIVPCIKTKFQSSTWTSNGEINNDKTNAPPMYPNGIAGIIETAFAERTAVKAPAKAIET